ncbi:MULTISPECIES: hypothetical protein [Caballeronia]|uniref:Uncharacterized protein n=1 Tax=Caballeronia jiangsuensis TaxID=1458357 RepID=A0ABW9CTM1_9BURK|nr:hypothetical protein [Caballeronia sp. GaOx3]
MSSKSDRDNRSNQLNPNNDAYWSSRQGSTGSDDDDDFAPYRDASASHIVLEPQSFYGTCFMAIVSFEGKTRHVRFEIRSDRWREFDVAESVWDAQLRWMAEESVLGVAYARIAGSSRDRKYHNFIWNSPKIEKSRLQQERARLIDAIARLTLEQERLSSVEDPIHRAMISTTHHCTLIETNSLRNKIAQAEAWYSTINDVANKFERAFEWDDHAGSEDLGVLTEYVAYDAPNPYRG